MPKVKAKKAKKTPVKKAVAKKPAKKVKKVARAQVASDAIDEILRDPSAVKISEHLEMLTGISPEAIDPNDALLTVQVQIGDKKFQQVMDEVYALKWDNARQRFSPQEIAKHLSQCDFYSATFLMASTEASAEYDKLENFYGVWRNEEHNKAEARIKEVRITEMEATEDRPKLRTQVGQITQAQIEAEICSTEEGKQQFLGWAERIREAKKNRDMMKGLYQICQNSGSFLQTLAKMFNVEEMAGRG